MAIEKHPYLTETPCQGQEKTFCRKGQQTSRLNTNFAQLLPVGSQPRVLMSSNEMESIKSITLCPLQGPLKKSHFSPKVPVLVHMDHKSIWGKLVYRGSSVLCLAILASHQNCISYGHEYLERKHSKLVKLKQNLSHGLLPP